MHPDHFPFFAFEDHVEKCGFKAAFIILVILQNRDTAILHVNRDLSLFYYQMLFISIFLFYIEQIIMLKFSIQMLKIYLQYY